jgi:hypothetical protein
MSGGLEQRRYHSPIQQRTRRPKTHHDEKICFATVGSAPRPRLVSLFRLGRVH